MHKNYVRLLIAVLLILFLPFLISSPAMASIDPLPLDQKVPGAPALASGMISNTEYKDDSIHAVIESEYYNRVKCHVVYVTIADPTQIRTAMSKDSYDDRSYVRAPTLAKHVNAIVAVNGDFFKYFYDIGYVVRQGVFYRDALNGQRDVLLIDDLGNFHGVQSATSESMKAFLETEFSKDRKVINSFTFGPVLVKNGERQAINTKEFQHDKTLQRVAVVQTGALSYAVVVCDGTIKPRTGMTLDTFAEYIHQKFPNCPLAYNLDGGGSANVIFHTRRIHENNDVRAISDILYFASAMR